MSSTLKRHDLLPIPVMTIQNSDSTVYDLTDHTIKFIMWFEDALFEAITQTTDTTVKLSASLVDQVEVGDIFLIDHERMTVDSVPTQPLSTDHAEYTVTRGTSISATAGYIMGSTDVAGGGATTSPARYRLSADAVFYLTMNGGAAQVVTIACSDTSSNASMADLVADINSAITTAGVTLCTCTNIYDKVKMSSTTTGTTSTCVLTSPNDAATDELGLVAAEGTGTDAQSTTAAAHLINSKVKIIKIETDAEINNITLGTIKYQWVVGDTDKLGSYYMEFEIKNSNGKKFTLPVTSPSDFTVTIVEDSNDVLL